MTQLPKGCPRIVPVKVAAGSEPIPVNTADAPLQSSKLRPVVDASVSCASARALTGTRTHSLSLSPGATRPTHCNHNFQNAFEPLATSKCLLNFHLTELCSIHDSAEQDKKYLAVKLLESWAQRECCRKSSLGSVQGLRAWLKTCHPQNLAGFPPSAACLLALNKVLRWHEKPSACM